MKKLAVAVLCSCSSISAMAGVGYITAGHNRLTYSESGLADFNAQAIEGAIGYKYDPYIGTELRYGLGLNDDEHSGFKLDPDYYFQLMAVPSYPINPRISVFGALGFTMFNATATGGGVAANDFTDTGISWGFGASFKFTPDWGMKIEYDNMLSTGRYDLTGFSARATYTF
nr:porin family protein [Oceanobacter mangrovi]